jgi:uncharacterized protein YrrD
MIQNTKELYGHKLKATDGEIGKIKDFYFDDQTWVVRYLVADTGSWLTGRKVLLSPHAFGRWDRNEKTLQINLTRQRIEDGPSIDSQLPVSRQFETDYYNHFGWPTYWTGGGLWGAGALPVSMPIAKEAFESDLHEHDDDDKHLRSSESVQGYAIHATDGEIGKVSGFLVDDQSWSILHIAVEAGHWYRGKEILVPVAQIERISYEDSQVLVRLDKSAIQETEDHQVVNAGS